MGGELSILWAVAREYGSLVGFLLNRGTGINVVDFAGDTALYYAIRKGNEKAIKRSSSSF